MFNEKQKELMRILGDYYEQCDGIARMEMTQNGNNPPPPYKERGVRELAGLFQAILASIKVPDCIKDSIDDAFDHFFIHHTDRVIKHYLKNLNNKS
jgi:hypothetical protein